MYGLIAKEVKIFLDKNYNFENAAETIARLHGEKHEKSDPVEVVSKSVAVDNMSTKSSSKWFSRENISERLSSYMKVFAFSYIDCIG